MKDLKFNEFLNRADDFIINVAMGGEPYRIKAQSGNAILISEEEYKKYVLCEKASTSSNTKNS